MEEFTKTPTVVQLIAWIGIAVAAGLVWFFGRGKGGEVDEHEKTRQDLQVVISAAKQALHNRIDNLEATLRAQVSLIEERVRLIEISVARMQERIRMLHPGESRDL